MQLGKVTRKRQMESSEQDGPSSKILVIDSDMDDSDREIQEIEYGLSKYNKLMTAYDIVHFIIFFCLV